VTWEVLFRACSIDPSEDAVANSGMVASTLSICRSSLYAGTTTPTRQPLTPRRNSKGRHRGSGHI